MSTEAPAKTYGQSQIERLLAGVAIIEARDPKAVGLHAEHDQLFIGGNSSKLTDEDRKKLRELGFNPEYDSWYMFCSS